MSIVSRCCALCDCGPRAAFFKFCLIQFLCAASTLASFAAAIVLQDDLDAIIGVSTVRRNAAYFLTFSVSGVSSAISFAFILSTCFCGNRWLSPNLKYLAIVMTIIWTVADVYLMTSEGGFQTCRASPLPQQFSNGKSSTVTIDFGLHICYAQTSTRVFGICTALCWLLSALWIDARLPGRELDTESTRVSQTPTRYVTLLRLMQFLAACAVLAAHMGTISLLQQESLTSVGHATAWDSPPHATYILWLCVSVLSIAVSLWLMFATCRYGREGMYCERHVAVGMTFLWIAIVTYSLQTTDTFQPCLAEADANNAYYQCVTGNLTCAFAVLAVVCWAIRAIWYIHGLCEVLLAKYLARQAIFEGEKEKGKETVAACVVCMTNEREMAFVPCGHFCVCNECSGNFVQNGADGGRNMRSKEKCPLCREEVFDVMRIYL